MKLHLCLSGILLLTRLCVPAQSLDSALDAISNFPNRLFAHIQRSQAKAEEQIIRSSEKYLASLERKEEKLRHKVEEKDSLAARNIFSESNVRYQQLVSSIDSKTDPKALHTLHEYIPGLDSVQSAFRFISNAESKIPGISQDKLDLIQNTSAEFQNLQAKLQEASDIDQFIKAREQQLKDQLSQLGFEKELAGINKEAFYYEQQLIEYKNLLHDPDKLEQKVLETLRDIPSFKDFFQKNSYLGQLFGLPENYGSPESIVGLQTRGMVQQLVANNIGTASAGSPNPEQFVMQQMQSAQQALSQLRNKLNIFGNSGGSGDIVTPSFKPNNEHTKTFLKRLEYGFNIQTQPSGNYLPAYANIGVIVGYKLSGDISFGVGGSYRLGIGPDISHIHFTNQGIGIRSYFDIKAKGNFYLSGGFEYNYMQQFSNLQSIADFDIWQRSALIGLSKQLRVTKNRKSEFQLLYDALYKQHTPPSAPIIFRMGYKF
jgi:hypothetical protein